MGINKSIPTESLLTIQTMMAGFHGEFYLKDDDNLQYIMTSVKFKNNQLVIMDLLVWPFQICPIGNSDGGLTDAAMIQCPEAQLSVCFLHKSTRWHAPTLRQTSFQQSGPNTSNSQLKLQDLSSRTCFLGLLPELKLQSSGRTVIAAFPNFLTLDDDRKGRGSPTNGGATDENFTCEANSRCICNEPSSY